MGLQKLKILTALIFSMPFLCSGQMYVDGDTLYGNEWINYDQSYAKISVLNDGIHRIEFQELQSTGIFDGVAIPSGSNLQVFHLGQEIPIFVNDNGVLGAGDYFEFYGKKNEGEIDKHLYLEAEYQSNTKHCMFSDTAAYFLTWNTSTSNLRFNELPYDNNNLPPAEIYCFETVANVFFDQFTSGYAHGGSSAKDCHFDVSEGFTASKVVSKTTNLALSNIYGNGPNAEVRTRFITKAGNHDINVSVEGVSYVSESFADWSTTEYQFEVPATAIDNTTSVVVSGNTSSSVVGVAFVEIKYPKDFDFGNSTSVKFDLDGDPSSKKHLEITNFDHGGTAPILYDLTNNLRLETTLSGSNVLATLPISTTSRTLVLVNTSSYESPVEIEPRTFIDYLALGGDYIIISNELLFDDGNGHDYVQDYVDYRSSVNGGSFNVVLAEVQQLYDQYGYGINRHEISMKNFTNSQIEFGNLEYLFLIGDGVLYSIMHNGFNSSMMVPTFGHPTSDHNFATDKGGYVPKIPVGRLAAQTGNHVRLYLNKVIEYEQNLTRPQTIEERAWMKNIIHLGGGSSDIQTTIKNELNDMKSILENSTFGAKVHSFFKTSSDVIQEAPSEQIRSLIDQGASIIAFFGHSAPSTLDFDLEDPNTYTNSSGKYPILYTVGCHTSRTNEFDGTLSEQWVLIEDKGAIAFIGATWETTLSNLSAYGKEFYQNYGTDNYGQRLGDIMIATINDFDLGSSNAFYANQLKQVNVIHGDPGLKLNSHEGPDYLVNASSVGISPSIISTQMDSFTLNLSVANIGSAIPDSFLVRIEQELPSGNLIPSSVLTIASPGYEDDYSITIPVPREDVLGFNKLKITVEANDSIPELPGPIAEMNNTYDFPFYVLANDAFPVYPYEYSIISEPNPLLKVSTANAFAESEKYYLQIDTTAYFNSPLKQEIFLIQEGGLLTWRPTIPYVDNTVYYWRVSVDSTQTSGTGFNWHESSFIYMDDASEGWNQSHFHQLKKENELVNLILAEPDRKLKYKPKFNELRVKNGAYPLASANEITPILNGGIMASYFPCNGRGVYVSVFDGETLTPWENPPGGGVYESHNCNTFSEIYGFPYYTNNINQREKLINFLDFIPDGAIVAVWTVQTTGAGYFPEDWAADSTSNNLNKNIFQMLEEQGATKVRQLETKGSVPYFFVYKKNDPDFLATYNYMTEMIADSMEMAIDGTFIIESPLNEGVVKSTIVGPSKQWHSLLWGIEDYEPASDQVNLSIYGLNAASNETLLHSNISVYDTTLTHINAEEYPYLRLEYGTKDSILLTTPHLDFWRVLYDPAPDAALRPDIYFSFTDSIQQGEQLELNIAIENITDTDMDSLLVHYTVVDQNNNISLTGQRMAPLIKGDTLNAHLSFSSKDITTPINQLIVEVNPNDDQVEQHHFNNIGIRQFNVTRDNRNPLLDVTFDGVHILDGDIVSAKPVINVILKDENKNLALNDTSLMRIKILYPEETNPREFLMSDDGVTFYPADESKLDKENKARIEVRKAFEVDGIYELSVRAADITGNSSGDFDYKIRFEVINEARVSNVLNYPNPFSTSTQFVFTLTGSEVPDFMKIQIMSVSGKVVREITQDELGPIHVGNNMTEYRWDGTDEYGDRLANGVYLYRVITREVNGEKYKEHNTNTNQYFKNGIGKMVIIR